MQVSFYDCFSKARKEPVLARINVYSDGQKFCTFFLKCFCAQGRGGQNWSHSPRAATKKIEKKCARLLPVIVYAFINVYKMHGRLNFAIWNGDLGMGCLWTTKINRFFAALNMRYGPPAVSIRQGHITHIKPRKNLVIFVAHRHPGPLWPNHLAKFKRPRVKSTRGINMQFALPPFVNRMDFMPKF